MPFGNLRENTLGAKRSDIIIISKCPEDMNPTIKKGIISKLNLFTHQSTFFSSINYSDLRRMTSHKLLPDFKNYSITLVTGIANPSLIVDYCKKNTQKVNHLNFLDHHKYTLSDIQKILKEYNKDKSIKKLILTTEKDAVKLKKFLTQFKEENIYYIPIHIYIHKKDLFQEKLLDYVKKN